MDSRNGLFVPHISKQFNAELDDLRNQVLAMGGQVEKQIEQALAALVSANSEQALAVSQQDADINFMEIAIDETCTRILARRQPAATDLRLVLTCSRAASDLERIGDEAARIARFALVLSEQGEAPNGVADVRRIGSQACQMVQESLDAFARFDADRALSLARAERSVDQACQEATRKLVDYMTDNPHTLSRLMNIMWVLRSLERIGDHACNIAEYVIYLVKGTDVRHIGLQRIQQELFDGE